MHPEWRTVIVTDEHRPLMNLRSPPGGLITPLRDPKSLARVWSTGKPSVGNLVSDHVGLRVPVAPEGRMAYTIAVPVDPRFFRDILAHHRLEQPWSAAVIGSDRAVIAATPESPLMEGQPLPEKLSRQPAASARPRQTIRPGRRSGRAGGTRSSSPRRRRSSDRLRAPAPPSWSAAPAPPC